jgi:hypothetical protein
MWCDRNVGVTFGMVGGGRSGSGGGGRSDDSLIECGFIGTDGTVGRKSNVNADAGVVNVITDVGGGVGNVNLSENGPTTAGGSSILFGKVLGIMN